MYFDYLFIFSGIHMYIEFCICTYINISSFMIPGVHGKHKHCTWRNTFGNYHTSIFLLAKYLKVHVFGSTSKRKTAIIIVKY